MHALKVGHRLGHGYFQSTGTSAKVL